MDSVEEFISSFKKLKWKSGPYHKLIRMIDEDRAMLKPLATGILREIPAGGTFLDDLLSHVSEEEFRDLVAEAFSITNRDEVCEAAETILSHASLQFPKILRGYLRRMFDLRISWGSNLAFCAWREADGEEIEELKRIVAASEDAEERLAAIQCLIETRKPEAIKFAYRHRNQEWLNQRSTLDDRISEVGFYFDGGNLRRRASEVCHHMVFRNQESLHLDGEVGEIRKRHPSWNIRETAAGEGVVGGMLDSVCTVCGGNIHALLRVERSTSLRQPFEAGFALGACLRCLGWEASPLFYRHAAGEWIEGLNSSLGRRVPEFPAEPLETSIVSIVPTPERWQVQDWGQSNHRENLFRIGGSPSWVQHPEFPDCTRCGTVMDFVAQFDSYLPNVSGDSWLWGSGGMGYFFWCKPCRISAVLMQCT